VGLKLTCEIRTKQKITTDDKACRIKYLFPAKCFKYKHKFTTLPQIYKHGNSRHILRFTNMEVPLNLHLVVNLLEDTRFVYMIMAK